MQKRFTAKSFFANTKCIGDKTVLKSTVPRSITFTLHLLHWLSFSDTSVVFGTAFDVSQQSGPCHLRPLHLTIPSILQLAIGDATLIFSIEVSLYFTIFNLSFFLAEWVVLKCSFHCACTSKKNILFLPDNKAIAKL